MDTRGTKPYSPERIREHEEFNVWLGDKSKETDRVKFQNLKIKFCDDINGIISKFIFDSIDLASPEVDKKSLEKVLSLRRILFHNYDTLLTARTIYFFLEDIQKGLL